MNAIPANPYPNPFATYAPQLGAELWRLAVRWSERGMRERPDTQSARVEEIRQLRPDLSRARAVEMDHIIWRAIDYICAARSPMYRAGRRYFARYGKGMTMAVWQRARDTKRPWHPDIPILPEGSLEDRLRQRTVECLRRASPLREGAAGGDTLTLEGAPDAATADYRVERYQVRVAYRGFSATAVRRLVCLPRNWWRTVYRRGLATVGANLVLSLEPLPSPDANIELYAAIVARNGAGYDVRVQRKVRAVARHDGRMVGQCLAKSKGNALHRMN